MGEAITFVQKTTLEEAWQSFLVGDYQDAIADYDQALALDPEEAVAYFNRGNAKGDQATVKVR